MIVPQSEHDLELKPRSISIPAVDAERIFVSSWIYFGASFSNYLLRIDAEQFDNIE